MAGIEMEKVRRWIGKGGDKPIPVFVPRRKRIDFCGKRRKQVLFGNDN